MAALVPQQGEAVKYNFLSVNAAGGTKRYQVDTLGGGRGADTLHGDAGDDQLLGDAGNDWLGGMSENSGTLRL